jgi:hypothetical protein
MLDDEEVRNFVTSFFRAEERGDVEYMLSQYGDAFKWGPERRDKASQRNQLNEFLKQWPVVSFNVGDIRVEHSAIPDKVTAYFEYRFLYKDPTSDRSNSGHTRAEWEISKASGALKIVSARGTNYYDSPTPSITPARGPWLFPDSSSRYLSATELSSLSSDDLWRARDEIFARNGYKFKTARGIAFARTLGNYYHGVDGNEEHVFNKMNQYEQANVTLIKKIRQGQ